MARYTQKFSLVDIFNNKNLKCKLPLVNYKEKELDDGRVQIRTYPKSVAKFVFDISSKAARPFYKEFKPRKLGNNISLSGNSEQNEDEIVDAVFNELIAQKHLLETTVNNIGMIRDALKETEKSRRKYGVGSKLFLKQTSMQQIENLNPEEMQDFLNDVMENIYYGDDYPKTQDKYKVAEPGVYEFRKINWKYKVGNM
jgi:hypothetical protein